MAIILGIETSCDETAAAVYKAGSGILSSDLYSQIELHKQFGGVVPEIASRSHLDKIGVITQSALDHANLTLADIDVVAVTCKPGLPGSLLVGLCFAKAIAWAQHKKLIGINHLEGHIFSPCYRTNRTFSPSVPCSFRRTYFSLLRQRFWHLRMLLAIRLTMLQGKHSIR